MSRLSPRVLLLNPPGRRKYLRDYYCSTVSKAGYYWHPMDLLLQSGHLAPHAHLSLLDAIAHNLSPRATLEAIRGMDPDLVVSLVGAQSMEEDLAFLRLARRVGVRQAGARTRALAISGEPVRGASRERLAELLPGVFLLQDILDDGLARWVADGISPEDPRVTRPAPCPRPPPRLGVVSIPRPEHHLFLSSRYRVVFDGGRPFASVLTAYGCPHRCAYCNSGLAHLGYATRPLEEVAEELDHLAHAEAVGHIFFRDMDLTASRARLLRLCELLTRSGWGFSWSCYARPDELDSELCEVMSRAGCRLLQLGLETFQEPTLARLDRPMAASTLEQAFSLARTHKMRAGAHLILGLPGEGPRDLWRTFRKIVSLEPDYVSWNVLQSRSGASLGSPGAPRAAKHAAPRQGSTTPPGPGAPGLRWARLAATWGFYLRPRYILRQLAQLRTPAEARALLRTGANLLWRSLTDP